MQILTAIISIFSNHGLIMTLLSIMIVLLYFIIVILLDEDRASKWRAKLYLIAFRLSNRRELEKRYISNDINSKINLARRKHHFGAETIPRSVKVEWIKGEEGSTYDLKEGEFIVRLDPAHSQDRNIVRLTCAIVERTTLRGVRHIIERPLQRAIDLNAVRVILTTINHTPSLNYFLAEEYVIEIGLDQLLRDWNSRIVQIDERGLFTRILLIELESLGKSILGMAPKYYMSGEAEAIVNFLYRIVNRSLREEVPLQLILAHVKLAIILIGQREKLIEEGIDPYINAVRNHLEQGIRSIYVIIYEKYPTIISRNITDLLKINLNELERRIEEYPVKKDFDVKYEYISNHECPINF